MRMRKSDQAEGSLLGGWIAGKESRRRDRAVTVNIERMENRALMATLGPDVGLSPRPEPRLDGIQFEEFAPNVSVSANSNAASGATTAVSNLETPFLREMAVEDLDVGHIGSAAALLEEAVGPNLSPSAALAAPAADAPPPPIAIGTRVYTPKLPTRAGESFTVYVRTPTTLASGIDEGNVRLFIDGKPYATAEVEDGLATFVVDGLAAGEYAIGARRFSTEGQLVELAASLAHRVYDLPLGVEFPTQVWMFSNRVRDASGFFTIKAILGDVGATGKVQLWDGEQLAAVADLGSDATAAFRVNLAPGPHQLRIVYLGDSNFQSASSILYSTNFT